MPMTQIQLKINNQERTVATWPMRRLLDVLRQEFNLTGAKEGCGEGECGACAVLVDGNLVNSCLVPVAQVEGAHVTTIEGLASAGKLIGIQKAFVQCGGTQCGICTPGMVMAALNLLRQVPNPSKAEIRKALAGNLCRCTGYLHIFESVRQAASTHSENQL